MLGFGSEHDRQRLESDGRPGTARLLPGFKVTAQKGDAPVEGFVMENQRWVVKGALQVNPAEGAKYDVQATLELPKRFIGQPKQGQPFPVLIDPNDPKTIIYDVDPDRNASLSSRTDED